MAKIHIDIVMMIMIMIVLATPRWVEDIVIFAVSDLVGVWAKFFILGTVYNLTPASRFKPSPGLFCGLLPYFPGWIGMAMLLLAFGCGTALIVGNRPPQEQHSPKVPTQPLSTASATRRKREIRRGWQK
jgi:hypothetical protein